MCLWGCWDAIRVGKSGPGTKENHWPIVMPPTGRGSHWLLGRGAKSGGGPEGLGAQIGENTNE